MVIRMTVCLTIITDGCSTRQNLVNFVQKSKTYRIMDEIMNLDTVSKYNDRFGVETLHPLVSVVYF